MPLSVYFDTSAFVHLHRRVNCTAADVASLRRAVYGGKISIPLSLHVLEEMLLARTASPQTYAALIRMVLSIAPARTLVRPCPDIIFGDLQAFAAAGAAGNPLLHGPDHGVVAAGIAELVESDGEDWNEEFVDLLERIKAGRDQYAERACRIPEIARLPRDDIAGRPTFAAFWKAGAEGLARHWADSAGVGPACAARGMDRLLELPSVRMAAGIRLSYVYGLLVEGHGIGASDAADQHHAISAAAVGSCFVSEDARLRKLIARVPMAGFETLDLRGFLDRLDRFDPVESA